MLHQIGIGTLGPVFRTYEPTRDRLVAVKVFRLDIVPEQAHALAEALKRAPDASLFHPSIVAPIAAGVEGTVAYRAEEYVAAESLDVAMRHYAPAPIEKVLPFITQLAGAIDFARAAGVGHGALHPRDVFVTPDEARATGFGVVEALEKVGVRAPVRRPYTAPERIDGAPWGIAADVFSLAAIAFELLTGRRPAGAGAEIGTLPDGPHRDAVHDVLARAMDADPARRLPNALAFASALEAASHGQAYAPADRAPAVQSPAPAAAAPLAAAAPPAAPPRIAPATPVSIVAPVPAPTAGMSPAPGEFEIEERLDPIHAALIDETPVESAAVAARVVDGEDELDEADAVLMADEDRARDRFSDDFAAEQADPEIRRPLEAVGETAPVVVRDEAPAYGAASAAPLRDPLERSMFSTEPESELPPIADPSRPPVLPIAVGVVLGLLVGFAGGYFVGTRDRLAPPAADSTTATAPASDPGAGVAPPGPATPDKPGQYSEQKVAPPPVRETPPIPNETARTPSRSAPATGRLVVRSTPSRASVTINGRWRGRTPLTLDDLPFGTYAVRVVQPGYLPAREDVRLDARAAEHTFSPRLTREASAAPAPARPAAEPAAPVATTGSLFVDSRPRGARVFVDGRSVGQTPLSLPEMSVGSHQVRIEMAGKQPWTSTAMVRAGAMARVSGSLEDIR